MKKKWCIFALLMSVPFWFYANNFSISACSLYNALYLITVVPVVLWLANLYIFISTLFQKRNNNTLFWIITILSILLALVSIFPVYEDAKYTRNKQFETYGLTLVVCVLVPSLMSTFSILMRPRKKNLPAYILELSKIFTFLSGFQLKEISKQKLTIRMDFEYLRKKREGLNAVSIRLIDVENFKGEYYEALDLEDNLSVHASFRSKILKNIDSLESLSDWNLEVEKVEIAEPRTLIVLLANSERTKEVRLQFIANGYKLFSLNEMPLHLTDLRKIND